MLCAYAELSSGLGRKDSLKGRILPELLYWIQTHQTLYVWAWTPYKGADLGESGSPGERVGHVWSKVGKFPALEESEREYPQNSVITWHKFNFLFLNLLKHFLKSKQSKYSNNNKKNLLFFYNGTAVIIV